MGASVAERSFTDAWIRSDSSTTRTGGNIGLRVLGGSPQRVALLQTPIPVPALRGIIIISAKLRLYQLNADPGNRTLTLHRVTGRWAESTLRWSNRPGWASSASASVVFNGSGSQGRVAEFDVTSDVQAMVDGGLPNFGWALRSNASTGVQFYSKDSSTVRGPKLLVEWAMAPERPTDLQPAGGLFTAVAKPMLRWTYADRGSLIQPLARVRVHVKTSNVAWSVAGGYAAPDFDSGAVDSTTPQLDLAATTFAGAPVGQTVWYSVQHQDSSGLWSPWSDPRSFGYQPAPEVSLVAPSTTVRDTRFMVVWATTQQSRYQVLLLDPVTRETVWDSQMRASVSLREIEVPRGVLRRVGQQATLVVRVWDAFDRAPTPGKVSYAETTRTVTYTETTAVAPVTDMEAFASADRPVMRLTWQRSSPPAQFGIWIDDVEQEVVDADDVATTGDGYAVDVAVPGDGPHDVSVRAIEATTANGRTDTSASANSPTLVVTAARFGVWLVVPDDPSRDIRFLEESGEDIVEATMPEVTARFDPVGSSTSVHVTSVLRWFEGSLTGGVLADYGNLTALELRRRMLLAKGDRLRPYTLLWAGNSVPVWISNVDVDDDYIPGAPRFLVSFDFAAAVPSPEYELQ